MQLRRRAMRYVVVSIEDFRDDRWLSFFVRVRTSDLIPMEKMSFLDKWNTGRK